MSDYLICAPAGAFGNHIRWLMLLDDQFQLTIKRKNHPVAVLTTVEQKVKFILDSIYPNFRSWHNWLEMEWTYREQIECYINLTHRLNDVEDKTPDCRALLVTATPELAYLRYLKFNSNLNNLNPGDFKKFVGQFNTRAESLENCSNLVINSDRLFRNELDKELYKKIIDFFQLKSYYSDANEIHKQWYKLHRKAEVELLQDLQMIYPTKEQT